MDSKITEARRRQGDQIEREQMQANLERDYGKRRGAVSMSDYTEAANYMLLAADSNDSWMKDRALRRGADELTRLQSEVERLRGRCGRYAELIDRFIAATQNAEVNGYGQDGSDDDAWIDDLGQTLDSAQRLRQQADEAEKAGGGDA